jgi:SAM-dependent methyltransferase
VAPREIAILQAAFPGFTFVEHAFERGSDVMHAIPRKLHAWLEGARRCADQPVVFLDCDTLVVQPLDDYLNSGDDWDILFTWKDEVFPVNTGVMAARRGELAAHLFSAMLPRIEHMISSKAELHTAVGSSGAADQHALREIIGFCNYDGVFRRSVTAGGVTRDIVFRGEPCRVFNETNCRAIDPQLRIIHYKTGWHPILLEGAQYTKNRTEAACGQMFRHWHEVEERASTHAVASLARTGARRSLDRFVEIAGGYEERGILHSEMLAVCGVSSLLGVDVVIESGRCRGQSTLVLAKFFERTKTKIVSIEWMRDENAAFAEQRLAPYKHVELLYGNAARLVPQVLSRYPGQRVALLLDGPKGQEAIDLARAAFASSPHLCAAFIHDMRIDTPQRPAAAKEPLRSFFTDDLEYLKEFSTIDEACLPRKGEPITVHTWRPYMKGEDKIPAYGPTLAVLLPRPARSGALTKPAVPPARPAFPPDPIPNRMLRVEDWTDPRYAALRETFNIIYRDELKGTPHPSHAKFPDKIATHWSREWEYPFAVINSEVTPGMRIVDLGCGGSPLIPYFVQRAGCRAAGVDLNLINKGSHNLRGFIADPSKVFPAAQWVQRSMADTGLPSGQWDRVLCISVLEHVTEDLARATFREVKRLLAPGGRSVITTDVDGAHRTLTIDFRRLIALAEEESLRLRGPCDFSVPAPDHRPGTYDVVGMVFESK